MTISRAIFDSLPDPVVLIDGERTVVYANAAAQELLECRASGDNLAMSIRHPVVLDAIERILGGAAEHTAEITMPVPIQRTFQMHASRVEDDGSGDSVVATVMFRDMTTAVRAEQMRIDFVNNASHELRSPLTAILGFIETLKGPAQEDPEASKRFLGIMGREAERMRRLIEDLLSLSRVEANEHVRPRGRADVVGVVGGVIDILEDRAKDRGMTMSMTAAADLRKPIGDADQLTQVFRNLIENALVYGTGGTAVEVSIAAVDRIPDSGHAGVVVRVTDHGDGIPKEVVPRLTERFYRGDAARSPDRTGNPNSTGLGLAIVKHIVNRHRGRLQIESEIGKGSTFSVFLPTD
ncbi:MAG: ATP-binding protein [Magnetovibrio sp.]|nr:ATP-binding protein [Magnetovibrio sp.]